MSKKEEVPSETLRRLIVEWGLQSELAREADVDKAALNRFVNGKVGLSLASLDRLAKVMGLAIVQESPRPRAARSKRKRG